MSQIGLVILESPHGYGKPLNIINLLFADYKGFIYSGGNSELTIKDREKIYKLLFGSYNIRNQWEKKSKKGKKIIFF